VAYIVNVGVALLVYALDDGVSRQIRDVQTQWTGCGPAYMGNKGAVSVRFRVQTKDGGLGEIYT
jgi:transcriptional/translational regulatory protein YebC/TACO1